MSRFKRCDECKKDISEYSGLTISPSGSVTISVAGIGNGPVDLCDWQCVGRYAAKRQQGVATPLTYNHGIAGYNPGVAS